VAVLEPNDVSRDHFQRFAEAAWLLHTSLPCSSNPPKAEFFSRACGVSSTSPFSLLPALATLRVEMKLVVDEEYPLAPASITTSSIKRDIGGTVKILTDAWSVERALSVVGRGLGVEFGNSTTQPRCFVYFPVFDP
jgi:hypothetical protein